MEEITLERSYALVGEFMSKWALAEEMINLVISTAIKLDTVQTQLIFTAVPVAYKIEIAKTLVQISRLSEEDKVHFERELNKFYDLMGDRNIVAHCPFFPIADDGAVKFIKIAAKGKYKGEGPKWNISQFFSRFDRLEELKVQLSALEKELRKPTLRPTLAEVLSGTPPNPFAAALAGLGKEP